MFGARNFLFTGLYTPPPTIEYLVVAGGGGGAGANWNGSDGLGGGGRRIAGAAASARGRPEHCAHPP